MQLAHKPVGGTSEPITTKDQLFASLCHEIRNPLNAIVGLSRIIANNPHSISDHPECAQMLQISACMLEELLNDILDYSQINAGLMELDKKSFDLAKLVEETAQIMVLRAKEKGIRLYVHCPYLPELRGDPFRLQQILLNLLSNAVKFTEEGFVSLYVTATPEGYGNYGIRMTVTDTGISIPKEKQAHIFDEYQQVDCGTVAQFGGSGLGLAICRRLVGMMGGTISVVGETAVGSQFSVALTLPASHQ